MKTKLFVFLVGKTLKKCAMIFLCALLAHLSFGQPPIQWQRSFGGSSNDYASSIIFTPKDTCYMISGTTSSNNGQVSGNYGLSDFWIVKTDSFGLLKWQAYYGGTLADVCNGVISTKDGGYLLYGSTNSSNTGVVGLKHSGGADFWIVKIDCAGIIQWQKCYGGTSASGGDVAFSAIQTFDGGYAIAGTTSGPSNTGDITTATGGSYKGGSSDMWVIRIDSVGVLKWQKCLGGASVDFANCIYQTSDGGFAVLGSSNSNSGQVTGNHGGYDFWFVKLDTIGQILWQKSLGGSGDDYGVSFTQNYDNGYTLVGTTFSSGSGQVAISFGAGDIWVVRIDSIGTIKWQFCYGGVSNEAGNSIIKTLDLGYLIVGNTSSNNTGLITGYHAGASGDYWLVKIDSSGSLEWQKCLGGSAIEFGNDCVQTSDGGYTISGFSSSTDGDVTGNHGSSDYWIVRLSSSPILPLPVELISFEANFVSFNKVVKLNWSTASEYNCDYFTIEKSSNAKEWHEIGKINSNCVSCTHREDYVFYDFEPFNNVSYYRLKQFDLNGEFVDLGITSINVPVSVKNISVYPNLTNSFCTIFGLGIKTEIKVYDAQNRMIEQSVTDKDSFVLDFSFYAKGVYIVHVIKEEIKTSLRIVKF